MLCNKIYAISFYFLSTLLWLPKANVSVYGNIGPYISKQWFSLYCLMYLYIYFLGKVKLISHPGPRVPDPPGKWVRQHLNMNKHYFLKEYVIFILIYLHPFFPGSTSGAGYLPDVFVNLLNTMPSTFLGDCSSYQYGEDQNIIVPPNPDTRGSRTPPRDQLYSRHFIIWATREDIHS